MSELNEDLLDEDIDSESVNEEEERLLLGDDEDLDDSGIINKSIDKGNENEDDKAGRTKFTTERKKITAPDGTVSANNGTPKRSKQGYQRNNYAKGRPQGQRPFPNKKNKTVLINPRFQGILHVNNNNVPGPLIWESQQNAPPINPWLAGADPRNIVVSQPRQMLAPVQAPLQLPVPPVPQFHQPHFAASQMQQNCPSIQMSYWDGQNQVQYSSSDYQMQFQSPMHMQPERQVFMSQPSSTPVIINTAQPPPQLPAFQNNSFVHQSSYPTNNYPQNQSFMPPPFQSIQQNNKVTNNQQFVKVGKTFNTNNEWPRRPNFQNKVNNYYVNNNVPKANVKSRIGSYKFQRQKEPELQVVPVVETVKQVVDDPEEDDETKQYRKKVEEQKRKREEFLRQKEEKRIKALKLSENHNRIQPVNTTNSFPQLKKQKSPNIIVTNGFSRRLSKYQKRTPQNLTVLSSPSTTVPVADDIEEKIDVKQLPGFLQDRTVLKKDESLMNTRTVVVKNLSSSTADKKIMMICRNIGEVQSLERNKDDCQATIVFKSVASAHTFYKKYQRHMLDLSMIEVNLRSDCE